MFDEISNHASIKSPVILYFRLTYWQILHCVGVTFFGYQDVIKDVFLLAKLILSIGGATILSDASTYAFAAIVSHLPLLYTVCMKPLSHLTFNIHRL